jgi:thioredoxin 1
LPLVDFQWVDPLTKTPNREPSRDLRRAALDVLAITFHVPAMSLKLTDANFQSEVIDSTVPVLVDFWAEWCGPCKMIGPVIDQVSAELEGAAKVGKVNVDEARELAVKYNVRSIPLLLFFKNGEVKDQIVGASVTKDQLKAKLQALA